MSTVPSMNRDVEEEEGEGERGRTTWCCGVLAEVNGVLSVVLAGGAVERDVHDGYCATNEDLGSWGG